MKKKIFITLSLSYFSLFSQNETSNMTNIYKFGYTINPALSSYDFERSFISFGHRAQWTNVYEAPRYFFGSYSYRNIDKSYSYNTYLTNNSVGFYQYTGLSTSYAYKLKINNLISTSFGISLNLYRSAIDNSRVRNPSNDDLINLSSREDVYTGNIDFGNVIEAGNVRLGVSVDNLSGGRISNQGDYNKDMSFTGYLGYRYGMNFKYKRRTRYGGRRRGRGGNKKKIEGSLILVPMTTVTYRNTTNENEEKLIYNAYLMSEIKKIFKIQFGYGNMKGMNAVLGLEIPESFEIYYGYDFGGQKLANISTTSHEISIIYNLLPPGVKSNNPIEKEEEGLSEKEVLKLINDKLKTEKKETNNISEIEKELKNKDKRIKELENRLAKVENKKETPVENKKINTIENRLNELEDEIDSKTLSVNNNVVGDKENDRKYINSKLRRFSKDINLKIDSVLSIINNLDISKEDENDNFEIDRKIQELRDYIDSKTLVQDNNTKDTAKIIFNQNISQGGSTEELENKFNLLEEYIDNKLKNIDNISTNELENKEDYEALRMRIKDIEDELKNIKNNDFVVDKESKEIIEKGEFYVLVGLYANKPERVKNNLISKGYIDANYFKNKKGFYYIYIKKFKTNIEAQEFIKNTDYKLSNMRIYNKTK